MQIVPPTQSTAKSSAPKSNGKGKLRASSAAKETLHLKDKRLTTSLSNGEATDKIATAAYYLAEQRGFAPGHELDDWLFAEQQLRSLHS